MDTSRSQLLQAAATDHISSLQEAEDATHYRTDTLQPSRTQL
jgi:hypothetical protein